jgi:hypothetical protein
MKEKLSKFSIAAFKQLPKGKGHLDFFTALLTIPVLLSVIILNYNNLQNSQKTKITPTPTPAPNQKQVIVVPAVNVPVDKNSSLPLSPSPAVCKQDIGPIDISSPEEGQTITDNPVCVTINYSDSNYCSVVWSYRINNGAWSDYSNNSPCIYNPPNGNIKFELRIQSTVSQNKTTTLTKNFIYKGQTVVTPTPSASSSAAIQ